MNAFRQLVASERPLVLPGAHDAISARLIKRARFKAYFIGGFPLVGARFGVPDIGLLGLGEIGSGVRDIMSASDLPVLVDCDNGYGDVKTVVHVINFYERLGAQAVFFEDQVSPKRCGHIAGKHLLSPEQMEANIRAAAENASTPRLSLSRERTRERSTGWTKLSAGGSGMPAQARTHSSLKAPTSIEEMRTIGRTFDVPQLANMLEGGRTPLLPPSELEELGFRIIIYGISPLMHAVRAMQEVLASLSNGDISFAGRGVGFEEYKSIVDFNRWADIENRYQPENRLQ